MRSAELIPNEQEIGQTESYEFQTMRDDEKKSRLAQQQERLAGEDSGAYDLLMEEERKLAERNNKKKKNPAGLKIQPKPEQVNIAPANIEPQEIIAVPQVEAQATETSSEVSEEDLRSLESLTKRLADTEAASVNEPTETPPVPSIEEHEETESGQELADDINPETRELIHALDSLRNKPRLVPLRPDEMKDQMLEADKHKMEDWDPVYEYVKHLEKNYGYKITLGSGFTPDQSMDVYQRMEAALSQLPRESYEGRSFKPVQGQGQVRKDTTIEFNADASAEELRGYLGKILNATGQEMVLHRKPETSLQTKAKVPLLEGEIVEDDEGVSVRETEANKKPSVQTKPQALELAKKPEEEIPLIQGEIVEDEEDAQEQAQKPASPKQAKSNALEPELVGPDEGRFDKDQKVADTEEMAQNPEDEYRLVEFRPNDMPVGAAVNVRTRSFVYKVEMRAEGLYISGNRDYCPTPTRARIPGSNLKKGGFAQGRVIAGMPFLFSTESSGGDVTTEDVWSIEFSEEGAGITPAQSPEQKTDPQPEAEKQEPAQSAVPQPEAQPQPEAAQFTEEELQQRLDAAREKYVKANNELDKFKQLRHLRKHLSGESQDAVNAAFEEAQENYLQARFELVGTNTLKHLREKKLLNRAHLEENGKLDATFLNKTQKFWNRLGEINLYNHKKNQGQEIEPGWKAKLYKAASLRTGARLVVMGVLLGTGAYWSAAAARGVLGFYGARGFGEDIRQARVAKPMPVEQLRQLETLDEVHAQYQRLATLPHFDGHDLEKIEERYAEEFKALEEREKELIEAMPAEHRAAELESQALNSEAARDTAISKQRSGKRVTTALGATAGVALGSWAVRAQKAHEVLGNEPLERAATKIAKVVQVIRGGNPTGATLEVMQTGDAVLNAGKRGIEGAISDLKSTDPEKYKGMISWLHEQYPGSKASDSSLIHRAIQKMAADNGFTVDGAAKNLSDIDAAKIQIHSIGNGKFSFSLDKDSVNFNDATHAATTPTPTPRAPSVVEEALDENPASIPTSIPAPDSAISPENLNNSVAFDQTDVGASNLDASDFTPNTVGSVSSENASSLWEQREALYDQALHKVEKFKKSSDALKHLLGKDYNGFLKETTNLSGRDINKIQDSKVTEFMSFYTHPETSPTQLTQYKQLEDSINSYLQRIPESKMSAIRGETIKNFLLRLASERIKP